MGEASKRGREVLVGTTNAKCRKGGRKRQGRGERRGRRQRQSTDRRHAEAEVPKMPLPPSL